MRRRSLKAFIPLMSAIILTVACGGGGGGGTTTSNTGGGGGGGGGGGSTTYTVGGTVTGLNGTLVLQNNGQDDLTITSNGPFTFPTPLQDGSAYNVTVLTQPTGQTCYVKNGSGTISGANVTNVNVNCYDSGTLDPDFGTGGIVIQSDVAGGNSSDHGYSIITDGQGRILVTGCSKNSNNDYDMVIWRFNPDGTPDTSFGNNGIVIHDNAANGNGDDCGRSITLDSQGNIYVAGYSWNGSNFDMVVWKFNSNGVPSTDFNGKEKIVHNSAAGGNGDDFGYSIVLDNQGKILVAGYSKNSSNNFDMVIWRFNSNGTLDSTFDFDGIVVHGNAAGGNGDDKGFSITLDSQGRILVAGYSEGSGTGLDMVIWKYNSDGTLDTSFGNNGLVVYNSSGGASDVGFSITVDSQDKILVAGYSYNNSHGNNDLVIWKYNSDGTPDTNFGTNGIVTYDNAAGGNGNDYGRSIVIDSQGRILVTGFSQNTNTDYDMVIWRFLSDGSLDTNFGNNGVVVHASTAGGNLHDRGYSITLDSDGKILVTGDSFNGSNNEDMVIWRYIP